MIGYLNSKLFVLGTATFAWMLSIFLKVKASKLKSLLPKQNGTENYYYHLIFTNLKSSDCREHMNTREECSETCSYAYMQKIVRFLASAENTISLCMYIASLETVTKELIKASKRGVKVRIIMDYEMTRINKSIYRSCKNEGIEVRTQGEKDLSMMHHKFCLVDANLDTNAKLFFGSMNLTMQGISSNFEQILFTNDLQFISRFKDEFEYLWDLFGARL